MTRRRGVTHHARVRCGRAGVVVLAALLLGACAGERPVPWRVVPGGDAEHGKTLVQAYGCLACHTISGLTVEPTDVAPPLDDFAERNYIAGRLPNEWQSLVEWLMNPQAVEPGTAMPDLGVAEAEARDIAAYLYTLGEPMPGPADSFPAPPPVRGGER